MRLCVAGQSGACGISLTRHVSIHTMGHGQWVRHPVPISQKKQLRPREQELPAVTEPPRAVGPRAGRLATLSLSLFICKMG